MDQGPHPLSHSSHLSLHGRRQVVSRFPSLQTPCRLGLLPLSADLFEGRFERAYRDVTRAQICRHPPTPRVSILNVVSRPTPLQSPPVVTQPGYNVPRRHRSAVAHSPSSLLVCVYRYTIITRILLACTVHLAVTNRIQPLDVPVAVDFRATPRFLQGFWPPPRSSRALRLAA